MRFEQLERILRIAERKSFSKAAEDLFVSQPSFSTSVKNLEEELNVKIFDRNNNKTVVTEQGEKVLSLAENIVDLSEKMKNIGIADSITKQTYSIAVSSAMSMSTISMLVSQAHDLFPEVKLSIASLHLDEIVDMLQNGNCFLGITICNLREEESLMKIIRPSHIEHELLLDDIGLKLFVSGKNYLAQRKTVSISELHSLTRIRYNNHRDTLRRERSINENARRGRSIVFSYDEELTKKLVSEDFGIITAPEIFAAHDLYVKTGLIRMVPIKESKKFITKLSVLYSNKKPLNYVESKLLEILRDLIKSAALSIKEL